MIEANGLKKLILFHIYPTTDWFFVLVVAVEKVVAADLMLFASDETHSCYGCIAADVVVGTSSVIAVTPWTVVGSFQS